MTFCVVEREKLLPSALMAATLLGYLPALPAIGPVYEIAQLREAHGRLWLKLVELDGSIWWWAIAFRPAVFREREFERLQALLDELPAPAPQRILADVLAAAEALRVCQLDTAAPTLVASRSCASRRDPSSGASRHPPRDALAFRSVPQGEKGR